MSRLQKFELTQNGYYCEQCNLYNDILTTHCRDCSFHRPFVLDDASLAVRQQRGIDSVIEWAEMMSESKIDKFQQFFNSGKILYSSMSFEKRREWRDELAEILMTARANLSAADWVDREESAKLTPEGRQWLESNNENGSNALNTPRVRKERQTKADKLKEQMSSLGLDMKEINSIMGQVEKTAKESNLNNLVFKRSEPLVLVSELCRIGEHVVCTGRFTDDKGSHECSCDCHKVTVNSQTESDNNKPNVFDASKLKFGA